MSLNVNIEQSCRLSFIQSRMIASGEAQLDALLISHLFMSVPGCKGWRAIEHHKTNKRDCLQRDRYLEDIAGRKGEEK